jgi:DNA-binding MarR family transcriptional regulator
MTIGELARAVGLSPGAATALIDRLEAAGIASRVPDPANRRRVLVQPAAEGRRRAYAVFAPMIARTMAFLESYSDKELLLIRDFLESARAAVTEHAETLRARQDAGERRSG